MPWSQVTVRDQREEFVRLARQPDANISELCRRYEVSRKTGYKWLRREDWVDRSRRPHHAPGRTSPAVEAQVVAVRQRHPAWGGRKIAHVLQRDGGLQVAPSTITAILARHGLIAPAASAAARPYRRFEHVAPNRMWQMDFKGHFATDGGRCHPLTVLDDHSRFNVVLHALPNEQRGSVQAVLQQAFARYGLPWRINTDNGPPWGSAEGSLTQLGVWLVRLGVRLSHSRPAHPQTNGKDERFHRTMVAEVLATRRFRDLAHVQQHFTQWRHVYNCQRPHEALDMATPASRYCASPRALPATLPAIEYGPEDIVRRVRDGGRIHFRGRFWRIGKALIGQPIALRPTADRDGVFQAFFCHQLVHTLDLNIDC